MTIDKRRALPALALLAAVYASGCGDRPTEPGERSHTQPLSADVGRPDCPTCGNFAHGSKGGSRLLASWPGSESGTTFVPSATLPAGLALCLGMNNNPLDGVTAGMTLPGAIQITEAVGCDRVLVPGTSYIIDFDASDTPGFAQVAARLTNGTNDIVWSVGALVDGSLKVILPIGGVTIDEQSLTNRQLNGGTSTGDFTGSDFSGFTLDFIRLRVSDIQISLSSQGGNNYLNDQFTKSWEFWGRIANAQ